MSNRDPQVHVAGSINMDIVAQVERHPIPGETVPGLSLAYFPGGKGANQAVAAARAGGQVAMIGGLGDDEFASTLLSFLKASGIDTTNVATKSGAPTGTALIEVDSAGENSIVVVPGANGLLQPRDLSTVTIKKGDVLVAQFETPPETTLKFFRDGREAGATCVLNPAPAQRIDPRLLALVDVLVLNETELGVVTGRPLSSAPTVTEIAESQKALSEAGFDGCLVATLGSRGSITMVGDRSIEVQGRSVSVVDTTGAGDCFVGFLATNLASGRDIDGSLAIANVAASICVQRPGAGPSMPTADEVASAA